MIMECIGERTSIYTRSPLYSGFLLADGPLVKQTQLLSFRWSLGYVSFHMIIYAGHENGRFSGVYYVCICPVTYSGVKS